MVASYPSDIATLTNPLAADTLNQPTTGVPHSVIETRQNEEILAIESELGLGLKGSKLTLAERLAVGINDDGSLKGAASYYLSDLVDVNITSGVMNGQLLRYYSGEWSNWTPNFLTSYTESDPIFSAWLLTNTELFTVVNEVIQPVVQTRDIGIFKDKKFYFDL